MTINNFMNMGASSSIHKGDAVWLFKDIQTYDGCTNSILSSQFV
jgi:hypothetical protein